MVADDRAARHSPPETLARAVERVGRATAGALVAERARRLRSPRPLPVAARVAVAAAAVLLLAGPAATLVLPAVV